MALAPGTRLASDSREANSSKVRATLATFARQLTHVGLGGGMAKGSIMLQIAVEQTFSTPVHHVPEIWTVVFAALDGERTTVREIASEKSHALMILAAQNNVIVPALGVSQDVATDVWLAFNDLRQPPAILHGPSHVPSPPVDGARLVLLRVRDFGMSVDQHVAISTIRRVGSHVYLDETTP